MKKVVGIALVALLAVACSKKEENVNKESNVMLLEPKVETNTEEAKEESKVEKEVATTEEKKEEVTETKKEEEKETAK